MRDDIGKRMIFAHDEVEVDVVFPLRPLSEREYFHRGEREERRHLDIRTESLRVRYFVFKMVERDLHAACLECKLAPFVSDNRIDNGVPSDLSLERRNIEVVIGFFGEQIKIDGFAVTDMERDCRATDQSKIFGKWFERRQKIDLPRSENLFMHRCHACPGTRQSFACAQTI